MSKNATCYNPDGSELPGNYPCSFPNLSTCCGEGWDCLSNGLCRQHGTTGYAQSTCTNPSYENCNSFCNQSQFDGFGEVSRCEPDGNSWCCAGAAGQGLGGPDCCDTDRTTSLEPYPFSTIDYPPQPGAVSTSAFSSTTLTKPEDAPSGTTLKTPTSSSTKFASASSPSSSIGTSLQSPSRTPPATSTQVLTIPSQTSFNSSSPRLTDNNHGSQTGIEIGIPVAVVAVLLAVLAFFIFQNRKFKHRLLQLRGQVGEGSLGRVKTRPETQKDDRTDIRELDLTHYELTQQDAPKHELCGNGIHELYSYGISQYELAGDRPRRAI